jgi:hypothetical protein
MFHVAVTISYSTVSGNNQTLQLSVHKNGSLITPSIIQDQVRNNSDISSTAIHVMVQLSQNDYMELFTANESNTNDLLIKTENMFAMGVSIGQD